MAINNSKLIGVESNKLPAPELAKTSNTSKLAIAIGEKRDPAIAIPKTPVLALKNAVARYPQGKFICVQADGHEVVRTYEQMWQRAVRILAGLQSLELSPGTPIVFQLNQSDDFAVVFWSCLMGGFIPVPTPAVFNNHTKANQHSERLRYLLKILKNSVIVTHTKSSNQVKTVLLDLEGHKKTEVDRSNGLSEIDVERKLISIEALDSYGEDYTQAPLFHHPQPDELALFLLSSGTTGTPKLVTFDAQTLIHRLFVSPAVRSDAQPRCDLRWLPLDHISGLRIIVPNSAKNIHLATEAVLKNPLMWLNVIQKHQVTQASVTNFFLTMVNEQLALTERTYDLASIKHIFVSAEPVVAKTARQFLSQLVSYNLSPNAMRIGYGLSECGRIASSGESHFSLESTSDGDSFVEIGKPNCDHSIRIVSEQNYLVEEESIGRIQVKGPTMTAGYYQNPTQNYRLFTEDGWLNTGDLGFLRDGCLTVTGREKEIIIINALNVSSYAVESIVEKVEGLVIGYTIACPVRDQTSSTDKLLIGFHPLCFDEDHLIELIQKIRRSIVNQLGINPQYFLPLQKIEIPRTETGKLQRSKLGRQFENGLFDKTVKWLTALLQKSRQEEYREPKTQTEQQLVNIWTKVLKLERVGINDNFFELGGHSLLATQLISQIREKFSIELPLRALFEAPTVLELSESIQTLNWIKQKKHTPHEALDEHREEFDF